MGFLKNIFGKKSEPIKTYSDFWNWFQANEKKFHNVVKNQNNIKKGFFDKLSPKLDELKDGYSFLTGMYDSHTAELIISADGVIKNIVFVEELIEKAPKIDGWKFTAHKPAMDINNVVAMEMYGYKFGSENMFFYSNDHTTYPDEIDISVVHTDLTEENKDEIFNGTYIFLDNYLGELDFLNNIDELTIIGKHEAEKELIPIAKLKDFLTWRQKEFVEKYNGVRYDTENDEYVILKAELNNGNTLISTINSTILKWDSKASHPWILFIKMNYKGKNGFPDKNTYTLLNEFEEKITEELKDYEGYLNIGRQIGNYSKEIYFACKDFRKPSKVLYELSKKYSNKLNLEYQFYKDKYWQSFERFESK